MGYALNGVTPTDDDMPDDPVGTAETLDLRAALDMIENLKLALNHARLIGTAMGILVERHRITTDEAFTRLQRVSQNSHRKLWMVAEDLTLTGSLDRRDHLDN